MRCIVNKSAITINQEIYTDAIDSLVYKPDTNFNGTDSVTWNASDGINYSQYSRNVLIVVSAVNDAPTVTITNPGDGSTYSAGTAIQFRVQAADIDGNIARVDFYSGTVMISSRFQPPYELLAEDIEAGNYTLKAIAFDNIGDSSISSLVKITLPVCTGSGVIFAEGFINMPGAQVSDLTTHPSYPNKPYVTALLDKFEYGNDIGDKYGASVRGYICAPQTGLYTFNISADDQAGLWLSTDDHPANKKLIAYTASWTNPREWNKFVSQKSAPVKLIKGARYYIETLHKESVGPDHLAVAWTLPNTVFKHL